MALNCTINADYNGKPLEVLEQLIQKRARSMLETTKRATIATAINVFSSLKADTRKAPLKASKKMYTIERTGLYSSWENRYVGSHRFRRVVRTGGKHGPIDWNVSHRCRNLVGKHYLRHDRVHVYKMQLMNENCKETVYYAHALNQKQARSYIERVILARMLAKEAGMARSAIGIAQAKVSDRPMNADKPSGSKQWRRAYDAAMIDIGGDSFGTGAFFVHFFDALHYSALALRHGPSFLDTALKRAANKTAGIIRKHWLDTGFGEDAQTPFPEVKVK